VFRFTYLMFAIGVMACGSQEQNNRQDIQREKDVYAIYSLMLIHPPTSYGTDLNEYYLISATTGSGPGGALPACVSPPKKREREYREMLDDYLRPKAPRQLKRALAIAKQYVFANAADVKEFIDDRAIQRPGHQPNERLRGVVDLFTLSDVSFNRRRTLALTSISSWCGGLCGLKQWKVFEKQPSGQWKELPWNACSVIAQRRTNIVPLPRKMTAFLYRLGRVDAKPQADLQADKVQRVPRHYQIILFDLTLLGVFLVSLYRFIRYELGI
jgi:hypothetical protein